MISMELKGPSFLTVMRGAFAGLRLGFGKTTEMQAASSVSSAPFHCGLVGGYDYLLSSHFSVGLSADLTSVGQADPPFGGSVKTDPFIAFDALTSVKAWF